MKHVSDQFIILTGGPGAGKTTLLEALQQQGYACSDEAGRGIIQSQNLIDGPFLPWLDPAGFAEQMLGWEMRSWHMAVKNGAPMFFDRGVPDIIGYLHLSGLAVPAHFLKAAEHYSYNRKVFILPHWQEIYAQDEERKQSFDVAVATYEAMVATYTKLGYQLIDVPTGPIEERVEFIKRETADIFKTI